jgi:hypothetical protein
MDSDDSLLKCMAVLNLQSPNAYDLGFLRSWFERPSMGSFPLYGLDRKSWDPTYEWDLAALCSRKAPDPFSQWVSDRVIPTFHHIIGSKYRAPVSEDIGSGIYEYNDSTIAFIAHIATTVVASVIPLSSVVILYVVKSNGLRLGIIALLSALFSLALALMTNARKIEIFAATSA